MRDFQFIDTKFHRNLAASSSNLKKLSDISTTPIYYHHSKLHITKLNYPTSKNWHSPLRKIPLLKLHRGKFRFGFSCWLTFHSGFSSHKPLAWGRRCKDWWIFYNLYFIIILVNNIYVKFDNISNFVFHWKKTKSRIERFVFRLSNVKKRNNTSQIHVFLKSFLKGKN